MKATIIGVFKDKQTGVYDEMNSAVSGAADKFLDATEKSRGYKKVTKLTLPWKGYDVIYLVGLGKVADYDVNKHRKLIGQVCKGLKLDATIHLDSFLPFASDAQVFAEATNEAIGLSRYEHVNYKKKDDEKKDVEIQVVSGSEISAEVFDKGAKLASAINEARDLLNMPSNKLTPEVLAQHIQDFAEGAGLSYEVLAKKELAAKKMGGILGVAQGSEKEAYLVVVKYEGNPGSAENLALVGKGMTYDTGGYSLKPSKAMYGMHGDMGGAATTFGAFKAIAELGLPVNVTLFVPIAENMVSATAIKPGDVLVMYDGTTVEVNNTDAEGRLILADALVYAAELGATKMINAATLTGAVINALGDHTTGLFANDDEFAREFAEVADVSGESVWRLPIFEPEKKLVKTSEVADLKNAPAGPGAITAAAFLQEFVADEVKWIHLDVAGTSETQKPHELGPKGATGAMIRTLVKYVEKCAK